MKVLIAVDHSDCSTHALEAAMRILPLRRTGTTVTVASVLPEPLGFADAVGGLGMPPGEATEQLLAEETTEARQVLDAARARLHAAGIEATAIARRGDPATILLEIATDLMPDVVVVGSHMRGALGRWFFGSVSDVVLHQWSGNVLVVPSGPTVL